MKFLVLVLLCLGTYASAASLETQLKGNWALTGLTCNGAVQTLDKMDYSLSFNGKKGAYVSVTKTCKQVEPEIYGYVSKDEVSIKQGVRKCTPNPCAADLPADHCGKETNPKTPVFKVDFKDGGKTMVLSTSDPNSIDCTDPGQSKPAVFTFVKK